LGTTFTFFSETFSGEIFSFLEGAFFVSFFSSFGEIFSSFFSSFTSSLSSFFSFFSSFFTTFSDTFDNHFETFDIPLFKTFTKINIEKATIIKSKIFWIKFP